MAAYESSRAAPFGAISIFRTVQFVTEVLANLATWNDGRITRNAMARLRRGKESVHEGKIQTLKRFKDDVREVQNGYECGIAFENYNDIKQGDVIECYEVEEIQREL